MNRIHKSIAERIAMGKLPTAYDGWDRADCYIASALSTRPNDYTRRGGMVIFEHERERKG